MNGEKDAFSVAALWFLVLRAGTWCFVLCFVSFSPGFSLGFPPSIDFLKPFQRFLKC